MRHSAALPNTVLASFVERLAEFHNEEYGSNLAVHHFNSYEFRHVWGGTEEEGTSACTAEHGAPNPSPNAAPILTLIISVQLLIK